MNENSGAGENKNSSRPKNNPSHEPLAAPASAARPYDKRPVMRSTVFRSLPMMAKPVTEKSAFASRSTTFCASGYDSYSPSTSPRGTVGGAELRREKGLEVLTGSF